VLLVTSEVLPAEDEVLVPVNGDVDDRELAPVDA
jgi:hypothetical protein